MHYGHYLPSQWLRAYSFFEYLREKIQEPQDKKELRRSFEIFLCGSKNNIWCVCHYFLKTMYIKIMIRFGFCDIQNNQGLVIRLWLILLTSTLIIPDLQKPHPIIYCLKVLSFLGCSSKGG